MHEYSYLNTDLDIYVSVYIQGDVYTGIIVIYRKMGICCEYFVLNVNKNVVNVLFLWIIVMC